MGRLGARTSPNAANASVIECPAVKAVTTLKIRKRLCRTPANPAHLDATTNNGAGRRPRTARACLLPRGSGMEEKSYIWIFTAMRMPCGRTPEVLGKHWQRPLPMDATWHSMAGPRTETCG